MKIAVAGFILLWTGLMIWAAMDLPPRAFSDGVILWACTAIPLLIVEAKRS